MKRKGRLCALIMALALACTGFSACNSQGGENSSSTEPDSSAQGSSDTAAADTSDEELSIHYLSARASTEGSLLSLQKIADEYKETHPNFTYEAEIISDRSSYLQKLRILASSDELPEWFDSDADSFFTELVEKDAVADIGALYDELGIADEFYTVAKDYQRLPDGFLGLISWQANTEYFWYYKPAFEAAGITETPKTFDEFFEACDKIKESGTTPIAMAGGDTWPLLRWAAFVPFRMEGNDFIEKARVGEESFGSETGLAAADFVQKVAPYFQEGWSTADSATAVNLVTSGQAAMIYDGTWQLPFFVDENMEMKEDFGYFSLPALSDNDATTSSDYWAHAGIGTGVRKDAMTDEMKNYFAFLFDQYADVCLYDFNTIPSMKPTVRDDLSELYQQMLDNFGNVGTYAYCWDVRIDAASNEVLGRETPNLALGIITPEEWAAALDEAVEQNAG